MKFYMKLSMLCITIVVTYSFLSLPAILFYTLVQQDSYSYYEGVHTTSENNDSNVMNNATLDPLSLNCSQGFFVKFETGRCSPTCSVLEELPHNVVVTFKVAFFLVNTFQFIGAIIALAVSIYNKKIMLKFPSIFLVYFLMGPIALSVVFFINFAGQESLLCHSSDDLIEIIEHSTPFCSFLGAVSIFTVITSNFWWLFHTISVFWKVWFPFHARQFDISGHTKYLHIATLIIAPIFSTIPVGVAFGTGGFVINSLIPGFRNCVNRSSESYFYLFILPICVIVAIGTTLILLTMWKMRLHLGKQEINFRAESKLMCFFMYFSITAVISLSLVTVGLRNITQSQQLFVKYFECQSFGVDPNKPCVLEVDRRLDQAFVLVFAVLLMFAPYAMMIYIIPVDKFKEKWQQWMKRSVAPTS